MSGRGPPPTMGKRHRNFVPDWESLPEGEWLETDESGTHWYLDVEGNYWHSTDDGYRFWVDEEEVTTSSVTESSSQYEQEDDDEADGEGDEPFMPVPRLGSGTAMLGIGLAFLVMVWTYFITMPTAKLNIELQSSEATRLGGEMSAVFLDGLELYQLLNIATLVIAVVMIGLAVMTITKKTPWWTVSASNFALLCVLFIASLVAFSSEQKSVDACDPLEYYCYQFEQPSLFLIDAVYPAIFSMVAFLIIFSWSLKAWANFDPNEEPEPELDVQIFSKDAPPLGAFAALVGLIASLAVLAFTQIFAVPAVEENLDFANDLGLTEFSEMFETVLLYNQLAVGLSGMVVLVSLLTLIKKVPWWVLPASYLPLIGILFMTVSKSDFNGLSSFEQDAFIPGSGSLIAMMVISASAYHTLMNHEWEELEDNEGHDDFGEANHYDFNNDEEEHLEWRGKVKTVVMGLVILMTGIGGFVLQQYVTSAANEPTFKIRDANGVLTNGSSDQLVVLDLMDKTKMFSEETIRISIQIDGSEAADCTRVWDGSCTFEYLEIFEDRRLTAMESILITEGNNQNWCSGAAEESCQITVRVTQKNFTEDEDMQVSVEVIELGSYTITVV
ncbi:hypothetical protein N9Y01_00785 [Candidatus Poseidonia alphae]|nr:hypothetical protein [Candidatus Poseidonia alphae]